MSKRRVEISDDLAAKVMFASDRTCCICRDSSRKTQIHHIDDDPSNNDFSNLAVICLDCHSDAATKHAFARNLTPELVRLFNNNWRAIVRTRFAMRIDQSLMIEYQQQVAMEISLVPHKWKNDYLRLYPGHFHNVNYSTEQNGGDVWDMMSEVAEHHYSVDKWRRYIPLFDGSLKEVSQQLDRILMVHGDVVHVDMKLAILRADSQIGVERSVYLQIPQIIHHFEYHDLAFAIRFKEVIRTLSHLSRESDKKLRSNEY